MYIVYICVCIYISASKDGSVVKNPAAKAGDTEGAGLIPKSERFSVKGNGNSLQYYCLENSVHRGAWWVAVRGVAKSWT